jgi:DNA-binding transcriptional LysR family regulator
MAHPAGFGESLRAQRLYHESFVVACSQSHPFSRKNAVSMAEMGGQTYLQRVNCEYRDYLREQLHAQGVDVVRSFRSEREDWIQTMVAAGMGVCFLPEFSATVPGLVTRPVIDPVVTREVCLVTVAGRRWSRPVAALANAVQRYPWPGTAKAGSPAAA